MEENRKSATPLILVALVCLAIGGGGGYFFSYTSYQPSIDGYENDVSDLNAMVSELETEKVAYLSQFSDMETEIVGLKDEILDDLNIKFTYHVQSTEKYAISYWGLYCCCLSDTVSVVDASEEYEVQDHWIKFTEGYEGDEGREVWFVLHVEYYTPCRIGETTYYIKGAQIAKQGTITGPTCGPGNTSERSSGITGVMIPMTAALGLIVATNKKFVSITVEK